MIWLNLVAVVLIVAYAQWLVYRGWRFARDLSHTSTAEDVLKIVTEQRKFYLVQGIGSLGALLLFLGSKCLLLLFTLPEPSAFTTFAVGDFASGYLIVKLGCFGVGLSAVTVCCAYQWLKGKHYYDVLYALRQPLGLDHEPRISRPPQLPPDVAHHEAF